MGAALRALGCAVLVGLATAVDAAELAPPANPHDGWAVAWRDSFAPGAGLSLSR
jgi:hypothetical protein